MKESCFNMCFASRVRKKARSILSSIFLLLFLFLVGCKSSNYETEFLSLEDHSSLESLFSHLLFYEGGAYTLFGSKPISFEVLSPTPEEEKQEFFSVSSHPILRNLINFSENWNAWERLKSQYKTPRFLLFQRNSPSFSPSEKSIFLVNISATAAILQKYYQKFRNAVNGDFDPLNIVFEMQNNQSAFWNTVLSREDLFGILLGFGEENSWFFVKVKAWQEQVGRDTSGHVDAFLASLSSQTPGLNALSTFDAPFPLPGFICYAEEESFRLIEKYEGERAMIKKIYKGKDLVQITLDRLTSKDLPVDPDQIYKEKLARELGIQGQLKDQGDQ